ncbi:hypothetical protein F383_14393 [Gossypium arboreum]|uniref:Uncharacterized protein n=1 Tax=Gossypium arboreum TaxID=29729 RepID=A0A0B0NH85_GOSAR|nr:hypothetical protein F383_14393 [Gossypium arboreum]
MGIRNKGTRPCPNPCPN